MNKQTLWAICALAFALVLLNVGGCLRGDAVQDRLRAIEGDVEQQRLLDSDRYHDQERRINHLESWQDYREKDIMLLETKIFPKKWYGK